MESILNSIKKLLGIPAEQENFDTDIIMHINSVFAVLHQLGVGPSECYRIVDDGALWEEFTVDNLNIENVRTYMYLKVRLLFDPPLSSSVLAAMERTASEYEWRLQVEAETIQNGEN